MTITQPLTLSTIPDPPETVTDAASESPPEPFGARLARLSRAAQGLPADVADPQVRARLRALCGLPKPAPEPSASDAPGELDPAGE